MFIKLENKTIEINSTEEILAIGYTEDTLTVVFNSESLEEELNGVEVEEEVEEEVKNSNEPEVIGRIVLHGTLDGEPTSVEVLKVLEGTRTFFALDEQSNGDPTTFTYFNQIEHGKAYLAENTGIIFND